MSTTRRWRSSYILLPAPADFGSLAGFGRALRRVREIGFEGVELNLPYPMGVSLPELEEATRQAQLPPAAFLTGWSYFNEGLCLCSPDATIRERAVARLMERLEVAAHFDATLVVGQMQGFFSDEPDVAVAQARIAEGLARLAGAAERRGARIVLEPVNHLQVGFNHTVADVAQMTRRVGSPALHPMVDTFHINIEEKALDEPIYRVGADLGHVHLCETNGGPFGSGHLDFAGVFRALEAVGYAGYVSCKVYRGAAWEEGAQGAMAVLRQFGAA